MKDKIKKFLFDPRTDKALIAFNFVVLGYGAINGLLNHHIDGFAGYMIAILWCFIYFETKEMVNRYRTLLDGAMEGWGKAIDFITDLNEKAKEVEEIKKP